ncbi:hypothetical protein H5410_045026 [Solanum commersonii]|uniref:Uncharacterized protein n=1 Tax=Solanum commersonii TaxID=4109 RepID=A0A9J5XCJ1_SOLCO|nr:hypothetical protein H5410_045026 [Solanum commersonii]
MSLLPLKRKKRDVFQGTTFESVIDSCWTGLTKIGHFNFAKQFWSCYVNEKPFDTYNFGIPARTSIPFETPGTHKTLVSRLTPSTLNDATDRILAISGKPGINVDGFWPLARDCHNYSITCLNVQFSSTVADSLVIESTGVSTGFTTVSVLLTIDALTLDLIKYGCSTSLPQINHQKLTKERNEQTC